MSLKKQIKVTILFNFFAIFLFANEPHSLILKGFVPVGLLNNRLYWYLHSKIKDPEKIKAALGLADALNGAVTSKDINKSAKKLAEAIKKADECNVLWLYPEIKKKVLNTKEKKAKFREFNDKLKGKVFRVK